MNPSTRYRSRLAPADSTRCTKGSLLVSARSCARRSFSRPICWIAPASIPESLATTMARARHIADAGDQAAAGHGLLEVAIEAVAGDRAELEPRRADVEQPRDALA